MLTFLFTFFTIMGSGEAGVLKNLALPDFFNNDLCLALEQAKCPETYVLKESFLNTLKAQLGVDTFIETGTYTGQTSLHASLVFDHVYTVELSEEIFKSLGAVFSAKPNISPYLMESPPFLKIVCPQVINKKPLIWLDAHYSAGITVKGSKFTPVLEELEEIKNSGLTDAVIMIDDIRFFFKNSSYEDYPSLETLILKVLEINSDYQYVLFGDILLAFPKQTGITISPLLWATSLMRLANEGIISGISVDFLLSQILQASDKELESLKWLSRLESGMEQSTGLYNDWASLIKRQ